jgi:hypothetical protein
MEPVPATATAPAVRDAILPVRARSLALRLLSGAGVPSLFGYAPGPSGTCQTLWHGLTSHGELVVAAVDTFDNPLTAASTGEPINVRLDIVKESPEWAARITACALHLLGTLEWQPVEATAGYLADPDLNPLVAEAAALSGGRLGVIHTDRVVLHDSAGIAPMPFAEVLADRAPATFPSMAEELSAREEFARLSQTDLTTLFGLADDGWDGALPLTHQHVQTCSSLHGRVLCVDIDRTGATLMQVDSAGTRTALFAFPRPVSSLAGLSEGVRELAGRATRAQATA